MALISSLVHITIRTYKYRISLFFFSSLLDPVLAFAIPSANCTIPGSTKIKLQAQLDRRDKMAQEYKGQDPLDIAKKAERDMNSLANRTGTGKSSDSGESCLGVLRN